jgi:kinetochore protein Mis13/DSN1
MSLSQPGGRRATSDVELIRTAAATKVRRKTPDGDLDSKEEDDGFVFKRKLDGGPPPQGHRKRKPDLDRPTDAKRRDTTDDNNNNNNDNNSNDHNEQHSQHRQDSGTTVASVDLPQHDTPVIRRNQELRKQSGVRRSSLGNRGRRMTSIGNGFVADPHGDIEAKDLFKHLEPDIDDVQRLKQIVIWCCKRLLETRGAELKKRREETDASTSEELTALTIARVIEEELLQDISTGEVSIDWKSRTESTTVVKKILNPQNVTNQSNLEEFERKLVELEEEKNAWLAQLERIRRVSSKDAAGLADTFKSTPLDEPIRKLLASPPAEREDERLKVINNKLSQLETTVASLRDGIHKVGSVSKATSIFLDRKMDELSLLLSSKRRPVGGAELSAEDILRALTRSAGESRRRP